MKFFIIVLLSIIPLTYTSSDKIVKIGGLFFHDESDLVNAFETAISEINELDFDVRLESVKHFLSEDDSIILQKLTCELIDNGVAAIFGPSSKASSDIVEILCNNTGIPHLQFDWHSEETIRHRSNHQMTVNVAPNAFVLATAYFDILRSSFFNWKSFTIVYESEESLSRMQQLLAWKQMNKLGIKIFKFNRGDDYRILWKNVKSTREKFVLLDCPSDIATEVVNASIFYNMTGQFNHLLLTNLDTHTSNLPSLYSKHFRVIIAAVRLRTYMPPPVHDEIDIFEVEEEDKIVSTRTMLLYDAVILFFRAIHNFIQNDKYYPPRISCTPGDFWETGPDILQHMKELRPKKTQPQYKTQRLQLNNFGERDDFNLEIYNPMIDRIDYVWNKNHFLVSYDKITENSTKKERQRKPQVDLVDFSQKRARYVVATRVGKPYFMFKPEPEGVHYEGNERFEGYAVDLIYKLAQSLEFDFVFQPVADNSYGNYDPIADEWNGIIRQLIDNNAQLGICDLTITQKRRTVVDFTVPFMQLGVSVLHYRTPPESAKLFAFLDPYSLDVWVYLILIMIFSVITLISVARFSQTEWEPPEMNKENVLEQENIWSWANIAWLVIGSNLAAGCDLLPRGFPMRFLTATMWIFAMVISQTYIAKLAAAINASKMENPVNNLHDLVNQNKINFGTIRGGATSFFFSESNETDYRKAWNKMQAMKPDAFTPSNELGVERVKHDKGKYAFLMETTNLQYNMVRNCELKQIGQPFGEKHYGIAMPLNAPYRSNMSVGILKLSEKGELYKLKQKWFFNVTNKCDESIYGASAGDSTFTMESVRGIFLVLGAGTLLSMLMGTFEFLWNVERISVEEKIPFMCALKPELKFFFKLWVQRKPLHTYQASNRDSTSTGYSSIDKPTSTTVARRKNSRKKKKEEEKGKCC